MTVARPTPNHLKLYTEPSPQVPAPAVSLACMPAVLDAFRQVTGWSLQYTPTPQALRGANSAWSTAVPQANTPQGVLSLHRAQAAAGAKLPPEPVCGLASALAGLLGESLRMEHALWQREAELATAVPVVPASNEREHLASRLQAVLKGAAEAVGCQAAALYLLDEATSQLKIRSCWGLPRTRLAEPARPLRGSVADLEAMLGNAVVLERAAMAETWRVPEPFPAAVCVPLSSATTILGTFWVFCDHERTFDDHQTNIIEIVAGRLVAELEREVLLGEGMDSARWRSQLAVAQQFQRDQLPSLTPQLDGWQLAGFAEQAQALGGDFFDWFCRLDGSAVVAVADAASQGPAAALVASAVKAALRSHGQYHNQPDRILAEVNQTLWSGSAGDQHAAALVAIVAPGSGRVTYSAAGPARLVTLGPEPLPPPIVLTPRLGEDPDARFESHQLDLQGGRTAVLFTEGLYESPDGQGRPFGDAGVQAALSAHVTDPLQSLAERLRAALATHTHSLAKHDRAAVLLRRSDP